MEILNKRLLDTCYRDVLWKLFLYVREASLQPLNLNYFLIRLQQQAARFASL